MVSDRFLARLTSGIPDAGVRLSGRMQTRLYRITRGRVGGRFAGEPVLVLTTTGRRSGAPRSTTVLYAEDDGRFVVIGSNTGSERAPAWALNLAANPDAAVEIRGRRRSVHAVETEGAERERLWQLMNKGYGGFDMYRARTDRDIKVFALTPE
jgi:deazaflavin-dependent oxidoreductase (nitroreductase family)